MNASSPSILLEEAEGNPTHDPLSKVDFLCAVETLADMPQRAEFLTDDLEAVFVACPYDTWKETFGEPRDIREHHTVQAWEQPCSDAVIHCVGYFVDDPDDGKWVVVTRVCLF